MDIESKKFLTDGYTGLKTASYSEVKLLGDIWEATMTISQSRTFDGVEWEERHSTIRATDEVLDIAVAEVSTSMLIFLESIGGDLFSMEDYEENDKGLVM